MTALTPESELTFPLLVGLTNMTVHEFYHALTPGLAPEDYALPALWESTVHRFPPVCSQLELVGEPGALTYLVRDVPVAAPASLVDPSSPEASPAACARWCDVRDVRRVETPAELAELVCYKVKPLRADATFGPRVLLHPAMARTCRDMAGRLERGREFAKFVYYTYACFVEPAAEEGIADFAAFREFYGGDVYAIELERAGGAALGLMWPDWICHEPDSHLELGVLYAGAGRRYEAFSGFEEGEVCHVRILARDCVDFELSVRLPAEPPADFSETWYRKQLAKANQPLESSKPSETPATSTEGNVHHHG